MVGRERPRNGATPGSTATPGSPAPQWTPAPLARRFGALVLDWILCLLISRLFGNPTQVPWVPVAILVLEYGFFLGLFGQTPGMWVSKIYCLRVSDGAAVGIPRALLRGILLALVVPGLIMDNDRRGLHDRAAGSVVVTATSASP